MHHAASALHVYERDVLDQNNDSLTLLARRIAPGAVVLDLGMGTGGLGRYLAARQAVTLDGVTLSHEESLRAQSVYRCVQVADLDSADLQTLFAGQRYDFIVCADVLEHLKHPERLLQQCRAWLKPGGQLLTSVPNLAYGGLLVDLMLGEFEYRPEGLLDSTHLRFFTRQSLQRFFGAHGWHITHSQNIQDGFDRKKRRMNPRIAHMGHLLLQGFIRFRAPCAIVHGYYSRKMRKNQYFFVEAHFPAFLVFCAIL
jgi:2-polyprenyl-3-methyl-5-hydroxy-6-metoxy-1,4-benzoquinol methylase